MGEQVATEAMHALPRIGEPAPDFEAVTTYGTLRLEDFRGSGTSRSRSPSSRIWT